jgi:hypothetical protein
MTEAETGVARGLDSARQEERDARDHKLGQMLDQTERLAHALSKDTDRSE